MCFAGPEWGIWKIARGINTWTNKIDMLNFTIWKDPIPPPVMFSYHHVPEVYMFGIWKKIMVSRSPINISIISTVFPCEVIIHCPPAVDLFEGQVRVSIGANISIRDYEPLPGATDENSKVGFYHMKTKSMSKNDTPQKN